MRGDKLLHGLSRSFFDEFGFIREGFDGAAAAETSGSPRVRSETIVVSHSVLNKRAQPNKRGINPEHFSFSVRLIQRERPAP